MPFFKRISFCTRYSLDLFQVFFQLFYGIWKISSIPQPMISIFGGARLQKDDHYFKQAQQLAQQLVETDISVLTGGGSGIMEAANCGAVPKNGGKGKSVGIGVQDLGEGKNPCVQEYFDLKFFFARKWLLTRYSSAFIVFPGGFGTMDELSEVITLIQTKKLGHVPIVLIGKEYWKPFIKWATDEALKHGLVSKKDIALFTVTDDLDEAFCLVRDECLIK